MNTKYKKLAKYIVYMKLIKSLGEKVEHARDIQYLCECLISSVTFLSEIDT